MKEKKEGDYSVLKYAWKIPSSKFITEGIISIYIDNCHTYNVENMKEYEITEKFNGIVFE